MDTYGKHLQVRGGGLNGSIWDTNALICRVAVPITCCYVFEAFLLWVLWFEAPGLARPAALLQLSSLVAAFGIHSPETKREVFMLMFAIQGFIFSLVAL